MSGITSAMNTALSGLELFESGINTVSNNLTNESTPGYSVESVNAQEVAGAVGEPGQGVLTPSVTRATNNFAAAQLRLANSQNAAASNQATQLTNLSTALTNNGDVQSAVNQFFNDISTLAGDPTSSGQAQTVLSDAQTIVGAFQNASGSIQSSIAASAATVTQGVNSANSLLQQLATLNQALIKAPNDSSLVDQQQGALNSLSSLLNVNAISQSNGTVLLASGGTILLDQSGAQTLTVGQNSTGNLAVTAGTDNVPVNAGAEDGSIGSALASSQSGTAAQQGLNAVATIFAGLVNTAQAQGLTSTGAQGAPLFSLPTGTATPNAGNSNTATVTVAAVNSSQLPTNGGPFTVTYNAGSWSAVNQATGQAAAVSGTALQPSFAGVTLNSSVTPANGDSWTVNPVAGAATGLAITATNPDQIAAADPYVGTPGTLQADGSISDTNGGTIETGADSVVATPAGTAAVIPSTYYGDNLLVSFTSPTTYNVSPISAAGVVGAAIVSNVRVQRQPAAGRSRCNIPPASPPAPIGSYPSPARRTREIR